MKDSDRKNKKIPSNQQSAIVGRPVKQEGSNSTHNKMSSAAAARILGITNIANATESVKNAIKLKIHFIKKAPQGDPIGSLRGRQITYQKAIVPFPFPKKMQTQTRSYSDLPTVS